MTRSFSKYIVNITNISFKKPLLNTLGFQK